MPFETFNPNFDQTKTSFQNIFDQPEKLKARVQQRDVTQRWIRHSSFQKYALQTCEI